MSMFTLYLFTVLAKIPGMMMIIMPIIVLVWVGCGLAIAVLHDTCSEDEAILKVWKFCKKTFYIFCSALMLYLFTPNMKEIAFIYIIGQVSQNEQVQEMPDKALQILNLKLDEYLKDLQPKTREN